MAPGDRRLANETWESLFTAHTTLMKQFATADVWRDVSMREYDVLYTLSKCNGPICLNELNRHLLLSQPALSRMIDRLVERGLVLRTGDPVDRLGCRLSLTDAGRTEQRHVGGRHGVDVARAMTAYLDDDELRQLGDLCRWLIGSAGGTEFDIDLDSDLMRLATGRSANGQVRTVSGGLQGDGRPPIGTPLKTR